jgi:hypothetical protein
MVSIVTIRIAVIISYNRKLQFPLGELRRELPITDAQVLFGHQPPERIGKDQETDLVLCV